MVGSKDPFKLPINLFPYNATKAKIQMSDNVPSTDTNKPDKVSDSQKPPKPEDKPFNEFIVENFIPKLKESLTERGFKPTSLELIEGDRPVLEDKCWMVIGVIPPGRRFWLCFNQENISSKKTILLAEQGADPSLIESFLIDEKKITLALLVSRLIQRLNGQKWIGRN